MYCLKDKIDFYDLKESNFHNQIIIILINPKFKLYANLAFTSYKSFIALFRLNFKYSHKQAIISKNKTYLRTCNILPNIINCFTIASFFL